MSDHTESTKYADAFWQVAPIPVVLGASTVLVWKSPSILGVVAVAVLAIVGLFVEVAIVTELRRKWHGEPPGPIARAFEGLGRHSSWYSGLSIAFMAVVFSALGYLVKGRSLGMSFVSTMVAGCGFVAVVVLLSAAIERIRR